MTQPPIAGPHRSNAHSFLSPTGDLRSPLSKHESSLIFAQSEAQVWREKPLTGRDIVSLLAKPPHPKRKEEGMTHI